MIRFFKNLHCLSVLLAACLHWSCLEKVPLIKQDVVLSDFQTFWFASEQTLFVFYTIENSHGISPDARVDINLSPFADSSAWQDTALISNVHQHESAICGDNVWCQSLSIRIESGIPQRIDLRYLYHQDGELAEQYSSTPLAMDRVYPDTNDSYQIYGVFDESNRYVQWRGWHNFPGMNQNQVINYGLRRSFTTAGGYVGSSSLVVNIENPTLYGQLIDCTSFDSFTSELGESSNGDPYWYLSQLGESYDENPWVCSEATVPTGSGSRTRNAIARKNPEFTAVMENLSLRFEESNSVKVLLAACLDGNYDSDYLDFQTKRMLFDRSAADVCIDDEGFNRVTVADYLESRILDARSQSSQEVSLMIVLHHTMAEDAADIQAELENALITLLADAALGLKGIFVYDSYPKAASALEFLAQGVWCPTLNSDGTTLGSCFLSPPNFVRGPLEVRVAPALPSYENYRELDDNQKNDIDVKRIRFSVPTASQGSLLSVFDSDSFEFRFADPLDVITVGSDHALSYCPLEDESQALAFADATVDDPSEYAAGLLFGLPPVHYLRDEERSYVLGVQLAYPFLLEFEYSTTARLGPKNVVSYVAIQNRFSSTETVGDPRFLMDEIAVGDALKHCLRFCDQPAFNDQTEYNFTNSWDVEYQNACHRPTYPSRGGL
ncbi:hypothetical protein [Pseudobacteriovorax antillogorgiicola]|uniref:Uncharacterized protein n=1 Tax=Pseudobacteriovorax antillogorgiicola TaxID=1513793 RepID=A0A1Y6CQI5_9BACT|nr:hypothetical protein [Pseudobacteriovorax antillogorgiicola]TCS45908.1 hypothetical protein EDD56_12671 [Pseudobacteriovorax antillogorgiicola]SMF71095.1 hypothetical protein SAMN06296036_12627 [Pseudobacteriovorax antillogorgiicola]